MNEDFARLGDLLGDVAARAGKTSAGGAGAPAGSSDPSRALSSVWPEVAGPQIAENATPLQLRQGHLVVATSSAAWAQTLQLMAEQLRAGLNERLGGDTVREIHFRHAGWENHGRTPAETPQAAPAEEEGLTDEQQRTLRELEELPLNSQLKLQMARAMKASFVRARQEKGR